MTSSLQEEIGESLQRSKGFRVLDVVVFWFEIYYDLIMCKTYDLKHVRKSTRLIDRNRLIVKNGKKKSLILSISINSALYIAVKCLN